MALLPPHSKPAIKSIVYRPMFTDRQMRRLELMRWMVRHGIVNEGDRQ